MEKARRSIMAKFSIDPKALVGRARSGLEVLNDAMPRLKSIRVWSDTSARSTSGTTESVRNSRTE